MPDSVLCHSAAANNAASLFYDYGSIAKKVYVRMQLYVTAAMFASFGNASFFVQSPDTNAFNSLQEVFNNGHGMRDFWGNWFGSNSGLTADAWHVFEVWYDTTKDCTPGWYKLDGIAGPFLAGNTASPSPDGLDTQRIWLGMTDVSTSGPSDVYLGKIDIGTSPGAHDVVQFDPASGSIPGPFGGTLLGGASTVALATAPTPPPASMYGGPSTGSILITHAGAHNGQGVVAVGSEIQRQNPCYLRFEFLITTAQSQNIVTQMGSDVLANLFGNAWWFNGVPNNAALGIDMAQVVSPTLLDRFEDEPTFTNFGNPTPDVWHVVELFWQRAGPSHIAVDGTTYLSFTGSTSGFYDAAWFAGIGLMFVSAPTVSMWVNRIQVGTFNGGSDILNYDPSVSNVLADALLLAVDANADSIVLAVPPVPPPAPPPSAANLAGFGGTVPNPISAAISGTSLVVAFDAALDPLKVPPPTQFAVNYDGSPASIVGVAVPGGPTCVLTTAAPPDPLVPVTIQYTKT